MTSFDGIVKDIGGIHTQLMDHSAFAQREAKAFVKEFEQRRGEKDVQNLSSSLELMTAADTVLLPDTLELLSQHLSSLQVKLYESEALCRSMEDTEHEKKRNRTASVLSTTASAITTSSGGGESAADQPVSAVAAAATADDTAAVPAPTESPVSSP
ncbi:hypothetical protein CAOG_04471 [Capsaspora owczarzaki ATCC 30864]|uniref:Biogenesis of lysosome-related organelles complex 1 subunit 5 n=1 Tax=Capsaspora owczarzaki (strain ATCC 30864) TaxID=595528 RepID=A0A0D2X355_CAPO3|nr:hypothetical protein CAOG_04471 [Capsaspora owczarzaki ATCC 30864]KJE93719.1 hypothetical protein CAOG_004471 [Capsaspora owczarzaki ATCC 30864]|eukprot:XP_004348299.2 hypothetical protein CAOG_04471 [Capsaspora owczarzaki ATCC 30864]